MAATSACDLPGASSSTAPTTALKPPTTALKLRQAQHLSLSKNPRPPTLVGFLQRHCAVFAGTVVGYWDDDRELRDEQMELMGEEQIDAYEIELTSYYAAAR